MITTININNRMNMISEMENDSKFQVLEYEPLRASNTIKSAISIRNLNELGLALKQVRIVLDDSAVKLQDGILSFMKGSIFVKDDLSDVPKFRVKLFNFRDSEKERVKTSFKGTGEIFLEPSFEYFTLIQLEDEEIIVNNNIFCACEDTIEVSIITEETAASKLLDEDGIIQLRLRGSGIAVLKLPVPENEILRCKLYKDNLMINGEFVVLRTGRVNFNVDESDNKLVNVYSGIGEVWLIPSKNIYDYIEQLDSQDYTEEEYDDESDEEDED